MKVNEIDNDIRLAGAAVPAEGGGVAGCHTTYVFTNTAERCTGTPSPEREALQARENAKWLAASNDPTTETDQNQSYAYGQILFKNIPADDLKVDVL